MAADAIRDGFLELMWIDPRVVFRPDDVEKLRRHDLPIVAGLCPDPKTGRFSGDFLPGTGKFGLGDDGKLIEVNRVKFGFTLTRRGVFGQTQHQLGLPICDWRDDRALVPWFRPLVVPGEGEAEYLGGDEAFCYQARQCGVSIHVDTAIRLSLMVGKVYDWESVAGVVHDVHSGSTYLPPGASHSSATATRAAVARVEATGHALGRSVRDPAQEVGGTPPPVGDNVHALNVPRDVRPLPDNFPIIKAYLFTYPKNRDSFDLTLADFRASDWGDEPTTFIQPADWPADLYSASRSYKMVLEQAAADGCDFALILEDDVRVSHHLRRTLATIPLIRRDQCDYFSLFIPDLIADPWERSEPHLGYRLARPRYSGPNDHWMKGRLWGSQGYLLSRRLIVEALARWDRLTAGQDCRVISVCGELRLPMWYSSPCLVEHAPLRSAFATPAAYAPDFDPDFLLEIGRGFQPPEGIAGWLTYEEGRLLWDLSAGRDALELGTASGRATVCLAQQSRSVVTIDHASSAEAPEWVRRYGLSDRVTFRTGPIDETCGDLREVFDLAFVDAEHDAAAIARNIASVRRVLQPGGVIAFHDYPDPGWPDVRQVVDDHARRLGWRKIRQVGYCAAFSTP